MEIFVIEIEYSNQRLREFTVGDLDLDSWNFFWAPHAFKETIRGNINQGCNLRPRRNLVKALKPMDTQGNRKRLLASLIEGSQFSIRIQNRKS
jgi:hypothetical protein